MAALIQHSGLTDPDIHEPKGAAAASNGDVLTSDGAGGTSFLPAGGSSFGQDYQTAVDTALSSTPATTFQDKVSLVTPALTGTYRIAWCGVVNQSTTTDAVQARLFNVTDAGNVGVIQEKEPKDLLDRVHVGGFAEVVFSGAAKTFTIQWRQQRGGSASIRDARIEFWRVG